MTVDSKDQALSVEKVSHNGRELELMLTGVKPMASFVAEDLVPAALIGDAEFEPYVNSGKISKHVYRNNELGLEIRCYCLPTEEWRGKLKNLLFQLYYEGQYGEDMSSDDRERIDGFLLGYSKEDVENHLEVVRQHYKKNNQ